MALNSAQESESSPDVIRHLVLLGDALQNIENTSQGVHLRQSQKLSACLVNRGRITTRS